jgi:hypothetical protein
MTEGELRSEVSAKAGRVARIVFFGALLRLPGVELQQRLRVEHRLEFPAACISRWLPK